MRRLPRFETLENRWLLTTLGNLDPEVWTKRVLVDDQETVVSRPVAAISGSLSRNQATAPHHNFVQDVDVNRDGIVTPVDALLVINAINNHQHLESVSAESFPRISLDVSKDNQLSAVDALLVINRLNSGDTESAALATVSSQGTPFSDVIDANARLEQRESCSTYDVYVNAHAFLDGTYEGVVTKAELQTIALRQQVELDNGIDYPVWATRYISRSNLVLDGEGIANLSLNLTTDVFDRWESDCTPPNWVVTETQVADFVGDIAVRGNYKIQITVESHYDIMGTDYNMFDGFVAGLLNSAVVTSTVDVVVRADYMQVSGMMVADVTRSFASASDDPSSSYSFSMVDGLVATGEDVLEVNLQDTRVRSLIYPPGGGTWFQEQYRVATLSMPHRPDVVSGTALVDVIFGDEADGPYWVDLKTDSLDEPLMAFVRGSTDTEALEAHDEVFEKRDWLYKQVFDEI